MSSTNKLIPGIRQPNAEDSAPGQIAVVVTPSDTVNFGNTTVTDFTRGLYVGATGNVHVEMYDSANIMFVDVQTGSILPIRCQRVNNTGTTATYIIALF